MAGLFEQLQAYIDANTPRNTRKPVNAGTVIDQGLLGGRIGQVPQRAQEMYQGLLGAPAELAALGSPAMRSKVDQAMTKPQPIDKDNAMQMAMDTLQTTSPVGGLAGMFIGKGAKTWDAIAAQKADDLLKQGIDPREVWKQTGTLKGVDGALRQEIPDNAFSMKTVGGRSQGYIMQDMLKADNSVRNPTEFINKNPTSPLTKEWELAMNPNNRGGYAFMLGDGAKFDDVVSHDLLSSAYPEVSSIGFSGRNAPDFRGAFSHADDGSMGKIQYSYGRGNISDWDSTTLHELQHAIQQREGWARGGSPDQFKHSYTAARKEADAVLGAMQAHNRVVMTGQDPADALQFIMQQNPENADKIKYFFDNYKPNEIQQRWQEAVDYSKRLSPDDQYRRLAGEAEARLTQSRMGLDAAQRLQHYPYDQGPYGLDVPLESLIVRGLLGQ